MAEIYRFPIMMAASVLVLFAIIWFVTRRNDPSPALSAVLLISAIISVGGMLFAKFGANFGLSWIVYYTIPALLTIVLPTLYFRMSLRQSIIYIFLAFLSAPAIHYAFSFFLGWNEYMPFLSELTN